MKLTNLLDGEKLLYHLRNGFVGCQTHPTQPLCIYNYTPRAAFANAWGDNVIDYCRGLIVNTDTYEIVARPFKKFHNLNTLSMPETMAENLPKDQPKIALKLDGSLGIWYPDGTPEGAIATRGSFTSPQAIWATHYWKNSFPGRSNVRISLFQGIWTPLFEIIYPENRIVVDYEGAECLVAIGGIYISDGVEVSCEHLAYTFGDMVVPQGVMHKDVTLKALAEENTPNEEGYVLTYKNGFKVKIKFEDYKRMHRIITGVNPRSLWELLRDDKQIDREGLPENFVRWADKWTDYLVGEHNRILNEATEAFANRPFREAGEPDRLYRASFARFVAMESSEKPYLKPLLFKMFDGFDVSPIAWAQIEPAGNDNRFSTSRIDVTADA